MKYHLGNTGFIADQNEADVFPDCAAKPYVLNIGFIISASPAMIADAPVKDHIASEIARIKFTRQQHMYSITDLVMTACIRGNKSRIDEYFLKTEGRSIAGYHLIEQELLITRWGKSGAIVKENSVERAALLSINNPHPVMFARDFIGYYFELTLQGIAEFVFDNKSRERCRYTFARIPLLAFKSENATGNVQALEISKEIFRQLTHRKMEIILG